MRARCRSRHIGASGSSEACRRAVRSPRARPIFAIASIPRWGREPRSTSCVSISRWTKPRCAIASCISVGSVTIAASARTPAATASVPTSRTPRRRPRSDHVAVSLRRFASAVASMHAARLPFMSYEPRPYRGARLDARHERIGHPGDAHCVHVRVEHQRPFAADPARDGDHVRPARRGLRRGRLQTRPLAPVGDEAAIAPRPSHRRRCRG